MRWCKKYIWVLVLSFMMSPCVSAEVVISEIMYDLSDSDSGREWVEINNTGTASVDIATSTWKFFESNTNHGLSLFQGNTALPAGGFAVIVDNPQKFLLDWPNFSGTIFDSVFSLGNTSEIVAIKSSTTTIADQVSYNSGQGASGDGNSLQKISGVWQAFPPTPGAINLANSGNTATTSNQSEGLSTATSSNPSVENTPPASGGSNWPVEPQIVSRIIASAVAISGADVVLKGEAVGLDKKPVENARFLWNFGDGTTKEGESVLHAYNFPGDYVVFLDVSSGRFVGSSRLKIHVMAADVVIAGVVSGVEGKIELVNNSNQELDLSWWRIGSGGAFFTLPKNTKLLSHGRLPLGASVLGFSVNENDLSLLYPNGSLAYRLTSRPEAVAVASTVVSVEPVFSENKAPVIVSVEQKKEKVVAEIATAPAPPTSSQVASVGASVEPPLDSALSGQESKKSSSLWLYGLGGVIILGLSFVFIPKKTELSSESRADEYEIIE